MDDPEPIDNEAFVEWTNEIFNEGRSITPRIAYVYSEESRQMLISMGYPQDLIKVLGPL